MVQERQCVRDTITRLGVEQQNLHSTNALLRQELGAKQVLVAETEATLLELQEEHDSSHEHLEGGA